MSLLTVRIVPADRRFVVESSFGNVCCSLYSSDVSRHMDFKWLCLVSVRFTSVDLLGVFTMCCRSSIVLCMPLVLNETAFMAGC